MAYTAYQIVHCVANPGASAGVCPAESVPAVATVYLPNSDPVIPTPEQFEIAGWSFALVLVVFVVASGVGMLIKMFRE